ncbi:MAG: hypothetical protein LBF28_01755 [Rickettsiales bacterium]|nr:hypothetical protein [Rickettsiales bacterium]
MNKVLTFALLATLALPAFAEEVVPVATEKEIIAENAGIAEESIVANIDSAKVEEVQKSNPKIKFPRGMQIGVGASVTSGLNGFIGYANKDFESFWWKRIGARFDFATTSPIKSYINSAIDSTLEDGIDVGDGMTIGGGTLSAKHMALLVDFYPFGNTWFLGGFRLSGGYVAGSMNLAATLTGELGNLPGGGFEFELDGINYKYTGDVNATANANWKYSGPYLGTGFDLGLFWGIKIYMDAGVVFTSKTANIGMDIPLDTLKVSDGQGGWKDVNDDQLKADFETNKANALREINDELEKIKFYPMVKLGFMYRF